MQQAAVEIATQPNQYRGFMKNITQIMQTHLNGEVLTIANCWKITRRDGVVLGFTDHDQPLTIDALTYDAKSGFTPTAIINSASLKVDNLDIEGMLNDAKITEQDIISGLYDFAELLMFSVNYTQLNAGKIIMRYGWLGELRFDGNSFVVEVRGLTSKLSGSMGDIYSTTCRAKLGDEHCKINMTANIVSGAITQTILGAEAKIVFYDLSRTEPSGLFTYGVLNFTNGANAGLSFEVKSYDNMNNSGRIKLMLPTPYAMMIGDTYSLTQGCDKRFTTCVNRFNNALNFRGEPHLIGIDRLLETSSTRN